jgi:16S rRNA (guanine966-N2)-methyltransferase
MKLFSPKTDASRPITDRVKESLFSVLYKYDLSDGKMVADLFCGVGSLGLEALSRGAEFVTFVEKDPKIIATLKKNIEKAGFAGESKARPPAARVIRADAFKIGAPVDEQKYDLVFVDPPYSTTRETKEGSPLSELLVLLSEQSAVGGIVVVRTERRTKLLEQYGRFEVIERRQWGTMAVTILQRSSK